MPDDFSLSSHVIRENPFMAYNHIEVGPVSRDHAQVYLDIRPESTNIYHVVHGGALFTMADCCAGLCARTDGRDYVTQDASVQFIRNVSRGRITATAAILSRGRRVCVVEVRITAPQGTLLFHGVYTMYCTRG